MLDSLAHGRARLLLAAGALGVALASLGCSGGGETTMSNDGGPPPAEPLFPANYADTYTEVRNCRQSGDHDLNIVRVLADPEARDPYLNRDAPIPVGGVVIKEEYDFSDTTCSGPIKQWTVMKRLADGSSPETLDWHWQRVDESRKVVEDDAARCYNCHAGCTEQNGGFEHTCEVP